MPPQQQPRKKLKTNANFQHPTASAHQASGSNLASVKPVQVLTATDIPQPEKGPQKRPAKRDGRAPQQPAADRCSTGDTRHETACHQLSFFEQED